MAGRNPKTASQRVVRFALDGQIVSLDDVDPTRTVPLYRVSPYRRRRMPHVRVRRSHRHEARALDELLVLVALGCGALGERTRNDRAAPLHRAPRHAFADLR